MTKIISDFKLQIELRRSASDRDKNWKWERETGLQSDID